jgi:hypothetical protein
LAPIQAVLGTLVSTVIYAVILTGVVKLFQIATDLREVKDLLHDIKRNTQDASLPRLQTTPSPESLLHAVNRESAGPQEPAELELPR